MGITYAHVVGVLKGDFGCVVPRLEFEVEEVDIQSRFSKAYVCVVVHAWSLYNMHYVFNKENHFSIKITPLGASLCLLEDMVLGEIEVLLAIRMNS